MSKIATTAPAQASIAPVVLAVIDGWGVAPSGPGNAVALAKTPFMDAFAERYKSTQLMSHGRHVGLLPDQEGNSEAGHMNIGAGRIVRQDIVFVSEAIKDRSFFKNTALLEAIKHAKKYKSKVHVMGMLAGGNSAHACPEHLYALLEMLDNENMPKVRLHLFTDGRDSPPFAATKLLHELEGRMKPNQRIASVMGRFYAMDRNKLWRRTELAYNAIVGGEGLVAANAHAAIIQGYGRGESDEFIIPTVISDNSSGPIGTVDDNDVVIFFNLRSDRARQLTKTFVQQDFSDKNGGAFARRKVPNNIRITVMTDFGPDLPHVLTAFPSRDIANGLTEVLAPLRQFYIAESEKYAHVTYFFNGGYADIMRGEERMRVPSAFVAHHDSKPDMRANAITGEVVRRLLAGLHDMIVINYANPDMVAHTGNLRATVKAVETVDACLGRLAKTVLGRKGHLLVVGDHGNAESMIDPKTGEVVTEHTANPVPFMIVGDKLKKKRIGDGVLADVAPTILDIMDVPKPSDMTGFTLLRG